MKYSKYLFIVPGYKKKKKRIFGHSSIGKQGKGKARKAVLFNTLPKACGYNSSSKPKRESVW